jgi:hypothetical protein
MIHRFTLAACLLGACQTPPPHSGPDTAPAQAAPTETHVHAEGETHADHAPSEIKKADPGTITLEHEVPWLKAYMELGEALVHSHAIKAKGLAGQLASEKIPAVVAEQLKEFPAELKGQRQRFAKISAEVHELWKKDPALQKGSVVMHCPMVPADWVQPAGQLRNPYMPETMLRCGYQVLPKK